MKVPLPVHRNGSQAILSSPGLKIARRPPQFSLRLCIQYSLLSLPPPPARPLMLLFFFPSDLQRLTFPVPLFNLHVSDISGFLYIVSH